LKNINFPLGQVRDVYFIALVKFKKKLTKAVVAGNLRRIEANEKLSVKVHGISWTLGRYDTVAVVEAPDKKVAMKMVITRSETMTMEILTATHLTK
jgi:uncharacterized protein with GYD domain